MFGTLKSPVAGLKVEPAVGATVCVTVTLAGVAPVMPVAWSLVSTFKVAAVANGVVRLSVTASIRATVALVVLLAALLSLVALVVPVNVTETGVVSVPPAVPGVT